MEAKLVKTLQMGQADWKLITQNQKQKQLTNCTLVHEQCVSNRLKWIFLWHRHCLHSFNHTLHVGCYRKVWQSSGRIFQTLFSSLLIKAQAKAREMSRLMWSLVFLQPLKMQQNRGKKKILLVCGAENVQWPYFCLHQQTTPEMNWPKGLVHEKKYSCCQKYQIPNWIIWDYFFKIIWFWKKSTECSQDPDVKSELSYNQFYEIPCTNFGDSLLVLKLCTSKPKLTFAHLQFSKKHSSAFSCLRTNHSCSMFSQQMGWYTSSFLLNVGPKSAASHHWRGVIEHRSSVIW